MALDWHWIALPLKPVGLDARHQTAVEAPANQARISLGRAYPKLPNKRPRGPQSISPLVPGILSLVDAISRSQRSECFETGGVMKTFALVSILVASVWLNGCCTSSPTEPSAPSNAFNGIVPGGGLVFHDLVVPSRTDSVDVRVHWITADAQLQLIQIDPYCDPTQDSTCRWLTDPQGPAPNSSREIWGYGNHQGSDATGRVRFVLRNLTPNVAATYTMTLTPQRHGTDC